MKSVTLVVTLVAAGVLVACSDPTSVESPVGPQFEVAGNSGCYTVAFKVVSVPTGPLQFSGPVTGDLEGTVTFDIDPGTFKLPGQSQTSSFGATADWVITGGIIPGLSSFRTADQLVNLPIDRPAITSYENIGTARAISGVRIANLSFKGTTTFVPPSLVSDHDWQGVICP